MSLTYQRSRITGAGLVAAQYDLTLERQTKMENILFIPGIANPVSEINNLLFGQGQQGGFWAPSYTSSLISGSTFGTGVETIPDLSPRNNPFSQATPASRAAWFREPKTGRRNRLTRSTQYDLSPWGPVTAGSGVNPVVTPNVAIAPDGSLTADQIDFNRGGTGASDQSELVQTFTETFSLGQNATSAIWLKAATPSDVGKQVAWRHVAAGAYGVITLTADWVRYTRTEISIAGGSNIRIGSRQGFSADVTVSVHAWNSQIELGTSATADQFVTTAFDVSESGQRDCYGLRTDGTDDWYITGNIDLSSIDKATVFAVVRKRSDALRAQLVQFPDTGFNAFHMESPGSALNDYRGIQLGSTTGRSVDITQAAPDIAILTMQCDLGAPLVSLRRNGGTAVTNALSTGGGNFQNAAFRLGSNGGSARFFNGDVFAIIMAGGSYPLSTIQRVERILSRITPTVNL